MSSSEAKLRVLEESADSWEAASSARPPSRKEGNRRRPSDFALLGIGVSAAIVVLICFAARLWDRGNISSQFAGGLLLALLLLAAEAYQCAVILRQRRQLQTHRTRVNELRKLALFDPLTGLYNRRVAGERLPEEMTRAERYRYPLAALCLDVNDLKLVNDRFGHLAGDAVLEEFARRIQRAIRFSDFPVRTGGDEFMILLPECTRAQLDLVLARLKGLEINFRGNKIPISFGAGWAMYEPGESPEEFVDRADQALYKHKKIIKHPAAPVRM